MAITKTAQAYLQATDEELALLHQIKQQHPELMQSLSVTPVQPGLGLRNQAFREAQGQGRGLRTFAINDPETCSGEMLTPSVRKGFLARRQPTPPALTTPKAE